MLAAIVARPPARQDLGERARIAEAEIDALPRQGVHIMRGVPHQGKPRCDELLDPLELQVESGCIGHNTQSAEHCAGWRPLRALRAVRG